MMIVEHASVSSVRPEWDNLAVSCFQKRKFLLYAERYNYCHQRYYELSEDGVLMSGACVYTLRLDLLTFANIRSPVRFNIVGIPASISDSGITGVQKSQKELLSYIFEHEKGMTLCLNLPSDFDLEGILSIRTLPTVCLNHHFSSWEEYTKALRSPYRRRLKLIRNSMDGARVTTFPCSAFTDEMYGLYMQIMRKTTTRLETLTIDFFRNLPPEFTLTAYYIKGRVINWHIVVREGETMVFFYGGTDYRYNKRYNGYFNNLAGILREGIEAGCVKIEFGQTAELTKARLGGNIIEKKILVNSNTVLGKGFLRLVVPLAGYRRKIPVPHVFRETI